MNVLKDLSETSNFLTKKLISRFLQQISRFGIFFISQLLDISSCQFLSWKQLCFLSNRFAKGKTPKWFTALEKWFAFNQSFSPAISALDRPQIPVIYTSLSSSHFNPDILFIA